jgi:hypothetical protein
VHGRPLFAGPPEAAGWVVSGASPQTWAHVHLAQRRSLGIAARRHPAHRFFASTRQRRAKKKAYKNGDEYKKSVMPVHTTSDRNAQVLLVFVTRAATVQWPKMSRQILRKRILQRRRDTNCFCVKNCRKEVKCKEDIQNRRFL